jgi:hypothetical protein
MGFSLREGLPILLLKLAFFRGIDRAFEVDAIALGIGERTAHRRFQQRDASASVFRVI